MKKTMTLTPGAVIEPVGDDAMVMMPGNTDVLRITGPAAETLRNIVAGQPVDASTPAVLELANHGIISAAGMSRRGLIRAGAIGAGASIAVLAMPSVAAAASVGGGGGDGDGLLGRSLLLTAGSGGVYESLRILRFNIFGFDFPNGLGEGSFLNHGGSQPSGDRATPPGALLGLPAEFTFAPAGVIDGEILTNPDGVRAYGADFVQWEYTLTGTPTGPLSASFVWDDVTYQVTFQPPA